MNIYEKVLLINLSDDTFQIIKAPEEEKVNYTGINQWFIKFANSNSICKKDRLRFLDFANINSIKNKISQQSKIEICYQRYINRKLTWCRMVISKTDDNNILQLTVEDIEDLWLQIEELQYRNKGKTRFTINEYIESLQPYGDSCAAILFEYNPEEADELITLFGYYFNHVFEYDSSHSIAILHGQTSEAFQSILALVYQELNEYNIHIGAAWNESYIAPDYLISKVVSNLQINK